MSLGNGLLAGRFLSGVLLLGGIVGAGVAGGFPPADKGGLVAAIDAAFDDTFERHALPGLALGVVVDGEVVYARTRGERVVGSGDRIDRETLFGIASNTKAMTAAVLARLVDQGRLRWDDPVVKYLPGFRMADDWVTREIQVRDLLIHNSGLPAGAGDLMLWPAPNLFTRDDVIAGLAYLKPAYSFRSGYAYDNTLYIVAGEVAAAAGGMPYDALVRRELFAPLGLSRCQVGAWQPDAVGNLARPHVRLDGRNVPIGAEEEWVPDVPMMAAGGIYCSLDDMLAWVRMWLQPQRSGLDATGRPWLSMQQRAEMWKAHTIMPLTQRMREWNRSHFSAYGYGWRLADVDGILSVSHTGTLGGMYSAVSLLPERHAGFVMMTNGEGDQARTVLVQVLQTLLAADEDAAKGHDVGYYTQWLARERRHKRAGKALDPPVPKTLNRRPAGEGMPGLSTGSFREPWFGEVSVCPVGGEIRFVSAKSPLLSGRVMVSAGKFLVDWDAIEVDAEAWLHFRPEAHRPGVALTMSKVDPEADFSYDYEDLAFVRVGDCPAAGR